MIILNNLPNISNTVRFIATETLSRIATAIREKDPDLGNPQMTPVQMAHYISILDPHGYKFDGGEGGVALNYGTNLRTKFQNNAVRMYPVISNQVTDMQQAFNNCRNLVGTPMCNDNVIYGHQMYRDCWNLTGEPQTGDNLQFMSESYYNCVNIHGNANIGPNVVQAQLAFWNCSNLDGNTLTIGPNVQNLRQTFYNCQNMGGYIPPQNHFTNLQDTYQAFYNCFKVQGEPIWGTQADMSSAYQNCQCITGHAACAPQVTNMINAYNGCWNLEYGVNTPNATMAARCYENCYNLKVGALNVPKATASDKMYLNCYNLMLAIVPPLSKNIQDMFGNCRNLRGSLILTTLPDNAQRAFENCEMLEGIYYPGGVTDANGRLTNMLKCENRKVRLNVVSQQRVGLTNFMKFGQCQCNMPAVTVLDANNKINVRLPLTYSNGMVYGNKYYECIAYTYNEEYNLYLYSMA